MPASDMLAARFARCVDLFRDPEAREEQKAELRALLGMLREQPLRLRDEGAVVMVNGTPVNDAQLGSLMHRLSIHNVSEIVIPREPPPTEVFELIKALADQPGVEELPARLRARGNVHVTVAAPETTPPPHSGKGLGTEGILRGEPMSDIASPRVRVAGVPLITYDPAPPPPETSLPVAGTATPSDASLPMSAPPLPPVPPAPPPPVVLPPSSSTIAAPARGPSAGASPQSPPPRSQPGDELLQELMRHPDAPTVGDLLAVLARQVETAIRTNHPEQALTIAAAIVRQEERVVDTTARRAYGIVLRRMYNKTLLQAFARFIFMPPLRADAVTVLRRGGADAVTVLLDVLVAAPNMSERRAAFDALRQMTEGTDQLIHMLKHHEWFVVRNVAELLGELAMEDAVPALAQQISHSDERVRKAAALALAKIGSGSAADALRRALRDKSPEVRRQVALGVGGRRSSSLAMPLVVALEEEKDEAIQRELLLALGRIGTPDAVQALIKVAQPSGRFFGRKPVAQRIAAIDALRLAGTPAAVGTLEGVSGDGDRQVKAAAKAALQELRKQEKR